MSSYLSLISDTTETDSYILASKSLSYTLSDTGLTCTRCTNEKKYGTGLLRIECHNSQLLNYSFLNLLQTIMISVQNLFSFLKIDRSLLLGLPAEGCYEVKIIIKHTVLMAVLAFLLHTVQNLISLGTSFVVHT